MLIFVYGTLRRGQGNFERYLATSRFVGEGTTQGSLLNIGHYPGAIPVTDELPAGTIIGELYEVDEKTLQRLDGLEGYRPHLPAQSSLFVRRSVSVTKHGGEIVLAEMYWWNRSHHDYPIVVGGDWVAYVNQKLS